MIFGCAQPSRTCPQTKKAKMNANGGQLESIQTALRQIEEEFDVRILLATEVGH